MAKYVMSEAQPIFNTSFIIFNDLSQMNARFLFDISSEIWLDRKLWKELQTFTK